MSIVAKRLDELSWHLIGMEVGLGPGHIVLNGDPALRNPKRGTAPNFRPMSIVAKRLYGSCTCYGGIGLGQTTLC